MTVRMDEGNGPEITKPEWADDPEAPTPEQWVDWFLAQSREAQDAIAGYHLACEGRLVALVGKEWWR